jgi:hypothetical protein
MRAARGIETRLTQKGSGEMFCPAALPLMHLCLRKSCEKFFASLQHLSLRKRDDACRFVGLLR